MGICGGSGQTQSFTHRHQSLSTGINGTSESKSPRGVGEYRHRLVFPPGAVTVNLIDVEGRLFGRINIIDALVVLLVAAVVVAGVALIGAFDSSDRTMRYATIELGEQPGYLAQQITPGDEMTVPGQPDNLTVTDVYVGPGADGNATVIVRAAVVGQAISTEDGRSRVEFAGESLRVGRSLTLETTEYEVSGRIIDLSSEGSTLPTGDMQVLVNTNLTPTAVAQLQEADTGMIGGRQVGQITSVTVLPSSDPDLQPVMVGLEVPTIERRGSHWFGSERLRIGAPVTFDTGTYSFEGDITTIGLDAPRLQETPVVLAVTLDSSTAEEITTGDSYRIGNRQIASVESVTVYGTDSVDRRRVLLGVTLTTLERSERRYFGDVPVRRGVEIPLRTDSYSIEGEIVRRGTIDELGDPVTRTITVKLENVTPDRADRIEVGLREHLRDQTHATVVAVDRSPTPVILESEDGNIHLRDHPRNQDLELTVDISARSVSDGIRFKGSPVREGDTVALDLGRTVVQGEVIRIDE